MAEFCMPSLGADMQAGTLVAWRKAVGERVQRGEIIAEVETEKGVIEVEVFDSGVVEKLLVEPGTKVAVGTPLASIVAEAAPVESASAPAVATGVADEEERRRRMRQAIAAAMSRSNREIPHYYVGHRFDFSAALSWLADQNARRAVDQRLVSGALLVKAVALGVRDFPELNARWEDDRLVPSEQVHVAMVIALRGGGLVVPALLDADRLGLDELMTRLRDLVERARRGQLRSGEVSQATITVTSLGDRGVELVAGVIHPPQTALVGFGTPAERPWVVDGQVVPRPVLEVTLAGDHRASDGHRGAAFLLAIERLLREPSRLM